MYRCIVDKKYTVLKDRLQNTDFVSKRSMALIAMARTSKALEIFNKAGKLKKISGFGKSIYDVCEAVKKNKKIDGLQKCRLCEKMITAAENMEQFKGMTEIEQLFCDEAYMILERWFYFFQTDFLNDDYTDYSMFIMFPSELLEEIITALNYGKGDDEIKQLINNNKKLNSEINYIDYIMNNIDDVNENLEKYIQENMCYDILSGII